MRPVAAARCSRQPTVPQAGPQSRGAFRQAQKPFLSFVLRVKLPSWCQTPTASPGLRREAHARVSVPGDGPSTTHAKKYLGPRAYFEASNADRSSALGLRLDPQNKKQTQGLHFLFDDVNLCHDITSRSFYQGGPGLKSLNVTA